MHSRAKVYQRKRPDGSLLSPYYHAWFLVWDAQQQRWKPKTVSTHASDPAKALEIAKEFERLALAAGGGPTGSVRLSREQVQAAIDDIMHFRPSACRSLKDLAGARREMARKPA